MSEHFMHVGQDFEVPDGRAKVTGAAKYADDYLFNNLLHAKTVKSPYAHARVRDIDTSAAEGLPGVHAVVTFEDAPYDGGVNQPALDEEPKVFGTPVAAVAATDEYAAADAVEAIDVEWEVLDHVIDPVETLKPGSPNARLDGNAPTGEPVGESAEGQGGSSAAVDTIKWNDADFSTRFPTNPGEYTMEWSWGDVEAGLDRADVVVEDTMEAHPVANNPMEPRSNVVHWRSDGTVMVWGSSQSVGLTYFGLAGYLGVNPADMVMINNYCGGGFGSKGTWYPQMAVPALLSREVNQPVKIRGTRKEEFFWGNGRTGLVYHFRIGVNSDGRLTGLDVQAIGDAGAYSSDALSGLGSGFTSLSSTLQPETMRARGIGVFTNTPKRWPMRGPGENQAAMAVAPLLDRAADELGIDPLDLRIANSPSNGDPAGAGQTPLTSAYQGEAYQLAADAFDYESKRQLNGQVEGSKVHGIGLGAADHASGYVGFDGLIIITPDGTVEVRTGPGNLGTESYAAVARLAAETLKVPWEQVQVTWGRSDNSAFTLGQFSSNTTFTTGLSQVKAAENAVAYLQEIAAAELGGEPGDYEVADGMVSHASESGRELSLGEAAELAIEMGGKYTGEEIPAELDESLNFMTKGAAADAIGSGLVAFGQSGSVELSGTVRSFNSALAHVTVDIETGKITVEEMANWADSGQVVHPESHDAQVEGGAIQGIGYALSEHYRFDEQTGIPVNADWYKNKPPSILDYSATPLKVGGVGEPDPHGPHGAKGVGEPPYGAASAAVVSAVGNALGTTFRRPPITPSDVLDKIAAGETEVV